MSSPPFAAARVMLCSIRPSVLRSMSCVRVGTRGTDSRTPTARGQEVLRCGRPPVAAGRDADRRAGRERSAARCVRCETLRPSARVFVAGTRQSSAAVIPKSRRQPGREEQLEHVVDGDDPEDHRRGGRRGRAPRQVEVGHLADCRPEVPVRMHVGQVARGTTEDRSACGSAGSAERRTTEPTGPSVGIEHEDHVEQPRGGTVLTRMASSASADRRGAGQRRRSRGS